jgi:acetyl esterase/lipase
VQAVRLIAFVLLLLPGLIPAFVTYLRSESIKKNIVYGPSFRHQLDVYLPSGGAKDDASKEHPVVIFVTGGAWIIGYKAWGQ